MKKKKGLKFLVIALGLCAVLSLGLLAGYGSEHWAFTEDGRFDKFADNLFQREVAANTLNLHYTLAHPEEYGITDYAISLGAMSAAPDPKQYEKMEAYIETLKGFDYKKLSSQNQTALDMLLLYFTTEKTSKRFYYLEEPLGETLGIQAQLPVLLAEYTFYDKQDIADYLKLLGTIDTYFKDILDFEEAKAEQGLFMSDRSLEGIISQCQEFIADPKENFLAEVFEDRLEEFSQEKEELSEKEIQNCRAIHSQVMEEHVIPAYEMLIQGLEKLKGTGCNENGLRHYANGRAYYQYLLRSHVGVYATVEEIEKQLYSQLMADYQELGELLKEDPTLVTAVYSNDFTLDSPQDALQTLEKAYTEHFPALTETDYQVKYVHPSLAEFLSPAFYLTPPKDTLSPNTIYINQASQTSDLELFATLAHEGFPGHLYQSLYFQKNDPPSIRSIISFGGYIEGWATYIEPYGYQYAPVDPNLSRLLWLNRSVNLCIYSLLDVGVHYYGWDLSNAAQYLRPFGITDNKIVQEIFQAVVEAPANYLRYYLGALNFRQLRQQMQEKEGDQFDIRGFHQRVLEIGPVQFPVLKKHLGL
ncbi:MAG: DUF885 domain-containing protein [Lachnospiraceae bacterium]|nr:DUF885 domain-containing protein [Lachnospiraceae bacterium]